MEQQMKIQVQISWVGQSTRANGVKNMKMNDLSHTKLHKKQHKTKKKNGRLQAMGSNGTDVEEVDLSWGIWNNEKITKSK